MLRLIVKNGATIKDTDVKLRIVPVQKGAKPRQNIDSKAEAVLDVRGVTWSMSVRSRSMEVKIVLVGILRPYALQKVL